uniref:INTS4 8 helical bundle domain-containing protein n=1 Tax=Canis lupus dingo TaxID=286419 RepID=A0A8C0JJ95_CANLU
MAAHLKKPVCEEFTKVVQQQQEEIATKKLRLTKPSKSAALHVDRCKAPSPADAFQYLLQFARKPFEAESEEGVVRILLEHCYKESDPSDSFVDKLLDLMPRLMTSKPVEVVKIIQTMLRQSTSLHLPLPEQIHILQPPSLSQQASQATLCGLRLDWLWPWMSMRPWNMCRTLRVL